MSYDTIFTGTLHVDPPLNDAEQRFLCGLHPGRETGTGLAQRLGGDPMPWSVWEPVDGGAGLRVLDGYNIDRRVPEWLRYLLDHVLGPGATCAGQRRFRSFGFDHLVTGVLEAQGRVDGDRWRLVADEDGGLWVEREQLPCPACWHGGVLQCQVRSAAYDFVHPDPRGNLPTGWWPEWDEGDEARWEEDCLAGRFRPPCTRLPVVWPFTTGRVEAPLAALEGLRYETHHAGQTGVHEVRGGAIQRVAPDRGDLAL